MYALFLQWLEKCLRSKSISDSKSFISTSQDQGPLNMCSLISSSLFSHTCLYFLPKHDIIYGDKWCFCVQFHAMFLERQESKLNIALKHFCHLWYSISALPGCRLCDTSFFWLFLHDVKHHKEGELLIYLWKTKQLLISPIIICLTFRKGITNGRSGKFVASCSLPWNSSMERWEFWKK